MERILLDRVEGRSPSEGQPQVPTAVVRQLSALPAEAQRGLRVLARRGTAVVALPLPGGRCAQVAFAQENPNRIQSVHVTDGKSDEMRDVTPSVCAEGIADLQGVYEALRQGTAEGVQATSHARSSFAEAFARWQRFLKRRVKAFPLRRLYPF